MIASLSLGLACLLPWLTLPAASPKHDVHISYCKSELTPRAFSGRLTIYRDDLSRALRNWKGSDLRSLAGPALLATMREFLAAHFSAAADGRNLPLAIAATGSDASSIWVDFSFGSSAPIGSLTVTNRILFREYGDQMNLIVVKTRARDYNFIFTASRPTASMAL